MPRLASEHDVPLGVQCPKRGCTAAWWSENEREPVVDALSTHFYAEHQESYGPPQLALLDTGNHWRREAPAQGAGGKFV